MEQIGSRKIVFSPARQIVADYIESTGYFDRPVNRRPSIRQMARNVQMDRTTFWRHLSHLAEKSSK